MAQFDLLKKKKFAPFFWTQFLGAFNDNLFKNAVVILFAFRAASAEDADTLVNLGAGIFILPFFLFSALAGQVADKFEKGMLIRRIKLLEIAIMALAAVAFFLDSTPLLLVVLFLMGSQSSLFGPVKYSILPQHLRDDELVGGNGLVEMGTFVAILVGTIVGGVLIGVDRVGASLVSGAVVTLAIIGWLASRGIPGAEPGAPNLKLNWNIVTESWRTLGFARQNRTVFLSILGISWFWFYGAVVLAQIPGYARDVLGGAESTVTVLLAAFSVGVGLGSVACEKLTASKIEVGLVPFGAFGLTLFGLELFFASTGIPLLAAEGLSSFFSQWRSWRILADLVLIGAFGGFYIVPLYALVQHRSPNETRSRIIAANNILNALFMVLAAVIAIALRQAGLSVTQLFLATAVANLVLTGAVLKAEPEFWQRFGVWIRSLRGRFAAS